ncbi:hypothetical protein [Actibacterium sp. 188UL27-1]|uniref:hypothetical protein n=1 Tax=Actibacterium sp. 188UL27-1 TaxID=2786961 RepID=UPI001958B6E9|nr:hypothetical protein [Actibacterium sp. 188UL27-1]MBM7067364.1 hypothetical protein [Actibacterium sp. 188UL27-1]
MTFLIPDIALSVAAIAGMATVLWHLGRSPGQGAVARQFQMILITVIVFQSARIMTWLEFTWFFRFATYASAALIPLMALLLCEVLLRRHAPIWAKVTVGGPAVTLICLAAWPGVTAMSGFIAALLFAQLWGFGVVGWLVWRRDRGSLSRVENQRIAWLGLSLVFILPFLASDYRQDWAPVPVRLSGLAILVTCWLSLWGPRNPVTPVWTLGWITCASVISSAVLWIHLDLTPVEAVQVGVLSMALILVFDLFRRVAVLQQDIRQAALLTRLAGAAHQPFDDYLTHISNSATAEGVLILHRNELLEFSTDALTGLLHRTGGYGRDDLPPRPGDDTLAQSQIRMLMRRYQADQVFLLSDEPVLLAVARGDGMGGRGPSPELCAAFAMARLIARHGPPTKDATA